MEEWPSNEGAQMLRGIDFNNDLVRSVMLHCHLLEVNHFLVLQSCLGFCGTLKGVASQSGSQTFQAVVIVVCEVL